MAGFSPSVDNARLQGVRVVRMPFPQGVGGVQLSLEQIAQRIREGANDKDVMGWAYDQLRAAGIDGRSALDTATRKMAVLLDAVRSATVYTADPPNSETVKSAAAMLCLRPGLCIRGGDCFPQGTLLLRDDWQRVPIQQVEAGQRIWGWNDWTTVERVWSKGELAVDAIHLESRMQGGLPWAETPTARSSMLRLTGDHKVYLYTAPEQGKRVHVSDLKLGDALLRPSFAFSRGEGGEVLRLTRCFESPLFVRNIHRAAERVPCWDISTADHYVYLPEHDVTVSNCDDQVVLLGSVLMSVGIPVLVVKQTFGAADQEHVLIHAQDEMGNWIAADPSTSYPLGQAAHASSEFAVDPLNPSMIGLVGVPEAEFIGIGAIPAGYHLVGSPSRRLPSRTVGAVVDSTTVTNLQAAVLDQANALDRTVVGCLSSIPAARLQQWGPLLKRATDYANEDASWWFAASQVDAGLAIQQDLAPWYALLQGYGCANVPLQPATPPSTFDAISGLVTTVAIAAGVVAVAYAVSKVSGAYESRERSYSRR